MHKLIERIFPEPVRPYTGRILITLLGFVVAVLFLTLGFWRTILIVALCVIGYSVGKWADGALDTSRLPIHHKMR